MKRLRDVVIGGGVLIFCAWWVYLLAQWGEPQSQWLVCDVLDLCGN